MSRPAYIEHRREMLFDLILDYVDDKGFEAVDIYDEFSMILNREERIIENRLEKVRQLKRLMGL